MKRIREAEENDSYSGRTAVLRGERRSVGSAGTTGQVAAEISGTDEITKDGTLDGEHRTDIDAMEVMAFSSYFEDYAQLVSLNKQDYAFYAFLDRKKFSAPQVMSIADQFANMARTAPGYSILEKSLRIFFAVRTFGAMPYGWSRDFHLIGVVTRVENGYLYCWQWADPPEYEMLSMFALNLSTIMHERNLCQELCLPRLFFRDEETYRSYLGGLRKVTGSVKIHTAPIGEDQENPDFYLILLEEPKRYTISDHGN